MRQPLAERKRFSTGARLSVALAFALGALFLRLGGETPPFDDVYHLKRIEFSAAHWPRALDFDTDRGEGGAFCPWPPLYDVAVAPLSRVMDVRWIAPVFFSLLVGVVTFAVGWVAGVAIATSPYLLSISAFGHLDHHFLEAAFVLAMLVALIRKRYIALGFLMAAALLVQPALLVAAAVCFALLFFERTDRIVCPPLAFAIAAAIVLLFRLTRPPGYPDSAWFLGYPHAAALIAAAVALQLRRHTSAPLALAAGAAVMLAFPGALLTGIGFFGSDAWLRSIAEFQPMFRDVRSIGTDLANLAGAPLLGVFLWRRHRELSVFAIVYLLLSLSSRRFLVVGIPLFAIAGALAVERFRWTAILATIIPPLAYLFYAGVQPISYDYVYKMAESVRALPPGRVLAPWSFGHAIDVVGRHAVVIDNFGSMPDETVFSNANDALLTTHASSLLAYCRSRGVRYLLLTDPRGGLLVSAASIGIDESRYKGTRLAQRTVWWRLYRNAEAVRGLTRIRNGAIQIWKID